MHRLNGQDAGFLHLELPIQPMNSMAMGVLAPRTDDDGRPLVMTRDDLRVHMARRLGELPSFRWRIVPVPFGLHHPVVVEDPEFDLDFHIRETTLPAPGSDQQLDRCFADLAERHLDRRHPLWQITLVHGLASGGQAVVLRYQHCLADGVAAVTTFSRVYSGDDHQVAAPAEPWQPEPLPRGTRLVLDACRDHVRSLRSLPPLVRKTARNVRAMNAHQKRAAVRVPRFVIDTPACSLNDAFTLPRTYTRTRLSLDEVKLVRRAAGVSVNDVALAIVGGGLRRYLEARNDLPAKPLLASVPVAFEPPGAEIRQSGNRFSSFTTTLATDVDDPWERLKTISAVAAEAKVGLDLLGPELMADWLERVPPLVGEPAVRWHHRARMKNRDRADVNILVSNLKGPAEQWHFGPATIAELYMQGPPSGGVGINVLLCSYGDQLDFSMLAFADALDAPTELADHFRDALDELVHAAGQITTDKRLDLTS